MAKCVHRLYGPYSFDGVVPREWIVLVEPSLNGQLILDSVERFLQQPNPHPETLRRIVEALTLYPSDNMRANDLRGRVERLMTNINECVLATCTQFDSVLFELDQEASSLHTLMSLTPIGQ